MSFTLSDIAERFGGYVVGDPATPIDGVATLANAGPREITFLSNPQYRRYLAGTRAGAVILAPDALDACPTAALVADDPYLLYARVASLYAQRGAHGDAGVHVSAIVAADAELAADVCVGPGAVVASGARLAAGVSVGAGSFVGEGVVIGEGTRVEPNVTLQPRVRIGRRCLLHPGVVVGADGFGIARAPEGWVKVPQLGSVVIGDDVEIGANTTVDRGALEDTVIEDGVKLDNQIQVAHNVRIGARTAIAGCTAIAGSAVIGCDCMIAGGVGIAGHIQIVDRVVITAMTLVTHSINEAGIYSGSLPMDDAREWRKNSARFRQLDALARRLRALEKKS